MATKHPDCVNDHKEYKGEWHLPSTPEHRVHGVLTGSEVSGFKLVANDSVDATASPFSSQKEPTHSVIHGDTQVGPVTLISSFWINRGLSVGAQKTECIYFVNYVAKGVHLPSRDHLRFRVMRFKLSTLCDWLDPRVFQCTPPLPDRDFKVEFSFPDEQLLHSQDGVEVHLGYGRSGPAMSIGQNRLEVHWEPQFLIKPTSGAMEWASDETSPTHWSFLQSLSDFLSIATGSPTYPFDIVGYPMREDGEADFRNEVSLYFQRSCPSSNYDIRHNLLSSSMALAKDAAPLARWLKIYRDLYVPIRLYADSLVLRNRYTPERFLNSILALEGMHRFANPGASKPSDDHKVRLNEIMSAIPRDHVQWLKAKLAFSHEPSLKERLLELITPVKETFAWLIGADDSNTREKQVNRVIKSLVTFRNTLAHSLPGSSKLNSHYWTDISEQIFGMALMDELGVSTDVIQARFSQNLFCQLRRKAITAFLAEMY